jgi:outer membrane autotransporter protein
MVLPATRCCKLIAVNGAATLNGGTVVVGSAGGFLTGVRYTILTATGGQTGAFSGVIDTIPFTTARLEYDDVFLVLMPLTVGMGLTPNQRSVAGAAGSLPFFVQLASLPQAQQNFALGQLSGEIHASNVSVGLENHSLFLRTLAERLRPADPCAAAPTCGGCPEEGWRTWGTPYGQIGSATGDGNAHGFRYDTVGGAAGTEGRLGEATLVGLSAGGTNWEDRTHDLRSTASVDSFQLALYGRQALGDAWLTAAASYEHDGYTTRRPIDFLAATASGSYSGNQAGAYLEGGYSLPVCGVLVQPIAALQYISPVAQQLRGERRRRRRPERGGRPRRQLPQLPGRPRGRRGESMGLRLAAGGARLLAARIRRRHADDQQHVRGRRAGLPHLGPEPGARLGPAGRRPDRPVRRVPARWPALRRLRDE